jgi:subfamily B ATP-binding cassette protein MsbA
VAPAPGAAAEAEPDPEARADAIARESLHNVLLAGLIVLTFLPLVHFGKDYLVEYMLGRVRVDIQRDICAKLLSLPLGFHHRTRRGDTLSRTMDDVQRSHRSLDLLFADVLQDGVAMLVGAVVLLAISWQLTLISLLAAPPVLGVITVFGGRIQRSARKRQEQVGDLTQRLVEILSGIKVIKAFRAEASESSSFERSNQKLLRRSLRVVKNRVLSRSLIEALNNGVGIAILLLGAWLVRRGQWGLSLGDLGAFLMVLQTTYRPVKTLAKGWTDLKDAMPSAARFFELLDQEPEVRDAPGALRIDGVREGIRFSKLSFSYGREPVLQDVSFEVRAGEVVALVGRTGAGKTTLMDLLLRFYDPDSGSIEIDGADLRRISRDSLLDQVAVVTQEPFLFAGSVADNLRYGRPDASDAEVREAARAAHVDEFAERLPQGYDTEVGELGAQLSGGQRQRITIARAILKDPAILIFDEATSALDAKSERVVHEAVETLLTGRTVFLIAHRLATVRRADKIVVIEDGKVTRVGNHDDLLAREGLYRELIELQGTTSA